VPELISLPAIFLLVKVCPSLIPTMVLLGATNDANQALLPFDTEMPAPGHTMPLPPPEY
jgi:hypothetical protein